jgi:hypothetical protein
MAKLNATNCTTLQVNSYSPLPQDVVMKIDTGKVSIGKITDVEKTLKTSSDKIDCLIRILVQKNYIKNEDIQDILDSIEVMEKLSSKEA